MRSTNKPNKNKIKTLCTIDTSDIDLPNSKLNIKTNNSKSGKNIPRNKNIHRLFSFNN